MFNTLLQSQSVQRNVTHQKNNYLLHFRQARNHFAQMKKKVHHLCYAICRNKTHSRWWLYMHRKKMLAFKVDHRCMAACEHFKAYHQGLLPFHTMKISQLSPCPNLQAYIIQTFYEKSLWKKLQQIQIQHCCSRKTIIYFVILK